MADADVTSTPDAPPKAGGLKAKLPLLLGVILGLGIGAGTGAMVVGPATARTLGYALPDSVVAALTAATKAQAAADGEHAEGETADGDAGDGSAAGDGAAGTAAPAVLTLENLVLNPAGSGGARFLLLTVAIECKDAATVTALQARDPELRDVVLSSLGVKTVEQLAEITAREQIKVDLVTALNERFGKKAVARVYFPQFVVQ